MSRTSHGVEVALRALHAMLRKPGPQPGEPVARALVIPAARGLPLSQRGLRAAEANAFEQLLKKLDVALPFEHLGDKAEALVEEFALAVRQAGTQDNVADFLARHQQAPQVLVCYMPVEHLDVPRVTEILGLRLLPMGHEDVPNPGRFFTLEPPIASVAAVTVAGTHPGRMAARARLQAERSLRALRVALRRHRGINDWQLRFRLAPGYAFESGAAGWKAPPDSAYSLTLDDRLLQIAEGVAAAALATEPTHDIERKADVAVRWMDRARFATEPLVALLYLFFALEALVGDRSEGLKAPLIAFRQAMLNHLLTGDFSHPDTTLFLYDRVRSGAVHGEDPPEVSARDVSKFDASVWNTLEQYLAYARQEGLTKRGRMMAAIDQHPDARALGNWLRAYATTDWAEFLDKRFPGEGSDPADDADVAG